jgi:hypothetical protein
MIYCLFLNKAEPPNYELMPNEDFRNTLSLIKDIFDSYNNSVASVNTKKDDYIQVGDAKVLNFADFSFFSTLLGS